jgi:hypothetical protein
MENQYGDSMLKLGSQNAQVGGLRLCGIKLGLGLGDIFVRINAGLKADLGQIERLPVGADRIRV